MSNFVSRVVRLAFFGIVSVLVILPWASASGASSLSSSLAFADGIIRLCKSDCSVLGSVPNSPDALPFDFEVGFKANSDGLDLRIVTPGSVFILGDVRATGDIRLRAPKLFLQGNFSTDANLIIENPDFPSVEIPDLLSPIDIDLNSEFIRLESTLSLVPATFGAVGAPVGSLGLVEAPVAVSAKPFGTNWLKFSSAGDIDLSMVTLSRLKVDGGVSIVASNQPAALVPEPTTALLLGFGLFALSAAHRLPGQS